MERQDVDQILGHGHQTPRTPSTPIQITIEIDTIAVTDDPHTRDHAVHEHGPGGRPGDALGPAPGDEARSHHR